MVHYDVMKLLIETLKKQDPVLIVKSLNILLYIFEHFNGIDLDQEEKIQQMKGN